MQRRSGKGIGTVNFGIEPERLGNNPSKDSEDRTTENSRKTGNKS